MNLAALGAIGPGIQQGQMNLADLRMKAQQIQQNQMALDNAKRELAGQAATMQGLVQPQSQPPQQPLQGAPRPPIQPYALMNDSVQPPVTGQPPMPGQASVPMQQPQMPPQQAPMGAPPPQPQMAPPGPQAQPQGGPPPQGGGQPPMGPQGAGGPDLSPEGQLQLLTQIAQGIKAKNPGIDNETLFEAVKQQIALLGSLSNTQKQQLVFATNQIKAETQQNIATQRTDTQKEIAQGHDDTSRDNTKTRTEASTQNTMARIADADRRLNQTQAAINARQDKSIQGRAQTKAQSDRVALLKTELAQAKQKLSSANSTFDQTKIAAAQKGVDDAYAKVLDLQKKAGGAAPAQDVAAPAPGARGPAPASLNNKPIWPSPDGKGWVYEDGTEAK